MTNGSLPLEILENIARHLDLAEYLECVHVHKTWTDMFRQALYTTVKIRTQRQFKQLYSTLLESSINGQKLGHFVESLIFGNQIGFTSGELDQLMQFCPFIQTIEFNPRLWHYIRTSSKLGTLKFLKSIPSLNNGRIANSLIKSLGSNLTQLNVNGMIVNEWHENHRLLFMLSLLPGLKKLNLAGEFVVWNQRNNPRAQFSLDDIDSISSSCPHLEHLSLMSINIQSRVDFGVIDLDHTKIKQSKALRVLSLQDIRQNHYQNVSYFIHKFPNLERFSWTGYSNEEITRIGQIRLDQETMESPYITMAKKLSRLKKIHLSRIPSRLWPGQLFFNILGSNNVSLESIKIMFHSARNAQVFALNNFQTMLEFSKDTLEQLTMKTWRGANFLNIMRPLSECRQLTYLSISGDLPKTVFMFDWILDFCWNLETVYISTCHVSLSGDSQEYSYFGTHRRLTSISIKFSILDVHDIIHHLTIRCPNISSLALLGIENEQVFPDRSIEINMPDHTFKSIVLKDIKCIRLNSDCERKRGNYLALLSISVLDKMNNILRRRESPALRWYDQDRQEEEIEFGMSRWYHRYDEKADYEDKRVRRLSGEEAKMVRDYDISSEEWDDILMTNMFSYNTKKQWNLDIPQGYIRIRCQSIGQVIFNEVSLYEDQSMY
ncbi:hypothetical protein CLU79DRAFT_755901 [Phycomyces nitens]|nr:hypothetical protein CLU79DRAFT_755901 [Phycomyces nitens]